MTRAEAICACTNILDLVECFNDRLPDQYARSVSDKMTSMRSFIKNEWRGSNVSEKMDRAIRNTWDGLRKWDRKNEQNDELFYGLADAREEAGEYDADPVEEAKQSGKRGVEADVDLSGLSADELAKLEEMQQASQAHVGHPITGIPDADDAKDPPITKAQIDAKSNALTAQDLLKEREQVISTVRNQFHEKGIRVLAVDDIKHGDIVAILKKTASDRTKQLIEAAYCAGKITGAYMLSEELKRKLK
jgi:hypothetical protein